MSRDGTQLWRILAAEPVRAPQLVDDAFWSADQVAFGTVGRIVRDGTVYLYGATPDGKLALARCSLQDGSLAALEDRRRYEFFVQGGALRHGDSTDATGWKKDPPARDLPGLGLENTIKDQGTFFWSPLWDRYAWIGGNAFPNAEFRLSLADKPEGPWGPSTVRPCAL